MLQESSFTNQWGGAHLRKAMLARANRLVVGESGLLAERFPDGVLLTLSNLLLIDSQREPSRVMNLMRLMQPWVSQITDNGPAEIREGTNNDIVEVLRLGRTSRADLKHTLTTKYFGEVLNLRSEILEGNPSPFALAVDKLLLGSDLDTRKNIPQAQIPVWAKQLIASTRQHFELDSYKDTVFQTEHNGMTTVTLAIPYNLGKWARNAKLSTKGTWINRHRIGAAIEVSYGQYPDSQIAFCNYTIGGRDPRNGVVVQYISLGMSSSRQALTEAERQRDTRMYDGLNSFDALDGTLISRFIGPKFLEQHPRIAQDGFMVPPLRGEFRKVASAVPNDSTSTDLVQYENMLGIDPFIYLPHRNIQALEGQIGFGEKLGLQKDNPLNFFHEALRTLRKASRTNGIDTNSPKAQFIKRIMRGETLLNGTVNVPETMRKMMSDKNAEGWNVSCLAEVLVGLFYAPHEFIELGIEFGFDAYFPFWSLLKDLVTQLPTKNDIVAEKFLRELKGGHTATYQGGMDGFQLILDRLPNSTSTAGVLHRLEDLMG